MNIKKSIDKRITKNKNKILKHFYKKEKLQFENAIKDNSVNSIELGEEKYANFVKKYNELLSQKLISKEDELFLELDYYFNPIKFYNDLKLQFNNALKKYSVYSILNGQKKYQRFKEIYTNLLANNKIKEEKNLTKTLDYYFNPKQFIIVSGFGQSGNSTVRDFLNEFENVFVLNTEDWLAKYAGGLLDLKQIILHNNNYYTGDAAIKRFIKATRYYYSRFYKPQHHQIIENAMINFINKLIISTYDVKAIPFNWYEAQYEYNSQYPNKLFVVKKLTEEQFDECAYIFLRNVYEGISDKDNIVLVNSLFNPHLIEGLKIYKNAKVITCARDKKDVYVDFKYNTKGSFIPTDELKNLNLFFNCIYDKYPLKHENILNITFEDFVNSYDETSEKIINFLNLDLGEQINKKEFFNPENSIKNIGIYNNYNDEIIEQLKNNDKTVNSTKLQRLSRYRQGNINLEKRPLLASLYSTNTSNLGDLCSSPIISLSYPCKKIEKDIVTLFNSEEKIPFENIIIGGGIHPWLYNKPEFYEKLNAKVCVSWGVGLQTGTTFSEGFIEKNNLIGVRDINCPQIDNKKIFYIPCSSCLNSAFDIVKKRKTDIKNKYVFYAHYLLTAKEDDEILKNIPKMDNYNPDLLEVLNFLNSAECVITNSYHGAYWALLLGKKVIYKSFYNKNNGFACAPIYVEDFKEYEKYFNDAKTYKNYLNEYREINTDFYLKILDLLKNE